MSGPDPEEARRRYDRMATDYDRSLDTGRSVMERMRRRAVAGLGLRAGDTVLDIGCGTGASFPLLATAVGPRGRVVGVDQSAAMLAQARSRIASEGWPNIELIEAPIQDARLPASADGALLFFTHDLLQTPAALDNVVAALRPGGRVATGGMKRPSGGLVPLGWLVWLAMRRYVTTKAGLDTPWALLAERLPEVRVGQRLLGTLYLCTAMKA